MHTHRGRTAGIIGGRILQRFIIAEALVQGVRIATIARRLGVSRSWASREANAPETRLLLSALVEKNAQRMGQLLDQGLTAIKRALSAIKVIRGSEGRLLEVPDHRVRLEAVGLFVRLVSTPAFTAENLPTLQRNVHISSEIENRRGRVVGPAHHKAQLEAVRTLVRIFKKLGPLHRSEPVSPRSAMTTGPTPDQPLA
jgi:hypothetical protein